MEKREGRESERDGKRVEEMERETKEKERETKEKERETKEKENPHPLFLPHHKTLFMYRLISHKAYE